MLDCVLELADVFAFNVAAVQLRERSLLCAVGLGVSRPSLSL